ncbi:MAG: hypothetical protein WEB57_12830 [Pseudohongiellaceae bacterium]
MQATVKDLRLHTRSLLAAIERGEVVEITYRGTPCARLSGPEQPLQPGVAESSTRRNPAFGIWQDHEGESIDAELRRLRQPRTFTGED